MKKHLFYFLITLFSMQNLNAQCDNVTSPGSIASDQVVCADNPDPFIISNVELPSGGSGDLEFLWIFAIIDPSSSTVVWMPIPDSAEDSYDPGPISYTTYYRRCSRRAGCSEYIGESNIITVEYAEECMDACEIFKVNIMAITPADCGLDNGMVNLSIVAGALPLSYNLNGETLDELPEVYAAGSYDLTVTDADGCTDNVSFVVEGVENTVSAVGDITNPICQSSNGSIDLTISGGTGEYTVIWNDGNTDIDRANLSAETYTVTVSDENGCSTQESFLLTVSDSDLVFSFNTTDASCDSSNGSAEVIIEGGTAPYVIELDGNAVTEISNLSPGSYIVSVTDANGCSEEQTLVIEGGSSTLSLSATLTNPICTANNGSIDLEINGATGPINISWDFNDSEDATQENLAAGTYEVTVTDENGCTASESFTLTAEESNLDINIIAVNANCGGTGSASVEASNGTAPYSILINGVAFANDNELASGDYIVNVTDANGCEKEATFTIIEAESDLAISGSTLNPFCSNDTGAITLTITGGTGIVSVLWEDGNTDIARIGLAAGTYSVTATDENACSISESFILTTEESDLSININTTDALCGGTGSANIEVSNGTEPYSISINGDNTLDASALAPGDYSVNATDANGCEVESSFTIEGGESDISISGSTVNPICSNNSGSISLVITGGTGAISVIWEDGNTQTERTNLAAGTYNTTAIDENGCTSSESFILTAEESDLSISVNTTDAICGGTGSASFEVSNGTEPFSFTINGDNILDASALAPGDYSVNATDVNGCEAEISFTIEGGESDISISGSTINPICSNNSGAISLVITGGTGAISVIWEDGNTETERTDLAAGTYNATAIDENGCTISESFILTAEESDLSISANTTDAVCGGTGSASFEVSNGTEPFSFTINGDNTLDASALAPGDYSVNATDANGCEAETSFSIESTDSDIFISGSTINPVCSNNSGAISLVITGGTGTISVIWEDGNIETERTDLAAGTYTVTATDENACTATGSFVLTTMDSNIDLSLSLTDVSCNGGDDGAAELQISGGTEPYIVTLDGIEVTEISNLSAGEYMVSVVDAEGCSASLPFSIAQAALLMVDANIQNATCGGDNGSIELILSGGSGNYTVVWDDNLSNDLIRSDLAMGTYSLSVKDENDCIVTTQFTLTGGDDNLETVLSITNVSCNGAADGSVSPTINNGTPPYLFILNNAVVLDLSNLEAGDYSLETTDLTGCSVTEEFTITEPSAINVAGTIVNETCGSSNGSITLDITGGTPNELDDYIIFWSSGNGMNLSAGDYTVTVTDTNGCVEETSFTLSNEEVDLEVSISTAATTCSDTEDGTANVDISGGTEPYSYILNGEAITELPVGYAAGDYTLTVAGGCSTESSFSITAQSAIELSAMITNADCAGGGEITLAVVGGTAPYDYLWSNDVTSQNLSDVTAGDYFVTVTDANGCTAVNAEAYSVGNDSATFTISTSTTPVSCFGGMDGTVAVSVDGGQEPYSYALDGMSLDGLPTNLAAGDYTLSVQDANGCSNETTFSIAQPDTEISYLSSIEYTICGSDFGSISLTPEGGTFPYEFLWSNGEESQNLVNAIIGSYTVTITDANGCSANNDNSPFLVIGSPNVALNSTVTSTSCGENNGSIAITISQGTPPYQIVWNDGLMDDVLRSDLSSGNYGVTITDANNCSISEEFSLASSIDFAVSITPVSASCNGMDDGQINMSFAGGTPPFTYILNGQALDDLPNTLPSDDYQLQVFDALGCSDLVEFSVGEPDEIIYLAEQTDANCPGEFVTVEFTAVQGGSGAYTYLWSDDVTTLNRDDLTSGTYFLTITDTNGCTAISEAFVADVPSQILISADEGDFQNVSCVGETDGSVDVTVTGGTPPYTYYWSNGATTAGINNLAPGDYLLQLTDANGCMTLFLAVISNPHPLSASSIVVDASCMMEDGSASIWPLGGTQPYFFHWENGSTSAEEFDLAPGTYKVTVSDFGSCEIVIDIEIGEMDCLQSETGEEFNFVMNELSADLTSHSVEIHWMTEAEANESFFIIQHSMDGDVFTDVGGLLPGQGATQSQNEYFNTCVDMAYGTHFFRIRYVDLMGNLRTSETMNVEITPENKLEFSIFPNPTMDDFRVNFLIPLDAPATIQIISAQAGILENITAPIGALHQRIDLRKYNPGVYFVVIEREGLRRLTKRIVKM